MAKRKPATISDENGFFDQPQAPGLIRMERERGEPKTADVHPAEADRWKAKGWREAT